MRFLIFFFLKNSFHSKRTFWMILLGLFPVGITLLLWLLKPTLQDYGYQLLDLFPQVSFFLYLHFLLPIMAVFIGSATLADEVEERTLPYLVTRPVPKWKMIFSKLIGSWALLGIILVVSLFLTYMVMVLGEGAQVWTDNSPKLMQSCGAVLVGLCVYLPLFAFVGGLLKRPVLFGLFFTFGWENTIAFFPGNAKMLTVAYYLHRLFPKLKQIQLGRARSSLLSYVLPTKQLSEFWSIVILVGLAALFIFLTVSILYVKEYRLDQR